MLLILSAEPAFSGEPCLPVRQLELAPDYCLTLPQGFEVGPTVAVGRDGVGSVEYARRGEEYRIHLRWYPHSLGYSLDSIAPTDEEQHVQERRAPGAFYYQQRTHMGMSVSVRSVVDGEGWTMECSFPVEPDGNSAVEQAIRMGVCESLRVGGRPGPPVSAEGPRPRVRVSFPIAPTSRISGAFREIEPMLIACHQVALVWVGDVQVRFDWEVASPPSNIELTGAPDPVSRCISGALRELSPLTVEAPTRVVATLHFELE